MKAKTYSINKVAAPKVEKRALELSVKKGEVIRPSEIISELIIKTITKLDIDEQGNYYIKE